MKRRFLAVVASLLAATSTPALAENADRNQPVNIEADRLTVDDRNKVHIFEGSVVLTQGSLTIRGDKLVVTQDGNGYQRGVTSTALGLASANTFGPRPSASSTIAAAKRPACSTAPALPAGATRSAAITSNTTRSPRITWPPTPPAAARARRPAGCAR